jgi:hypothetical protein
VDVLALGEGSGGVLGLNTESVGTEVVTLGLEKVCGKVLGAVSVVEGESGGEGGGGDTKLNTLADGASPSGLSVVDGVLEEVVEEKVLKVGLSTESLGDVSEENGADDTSSTPHEGNGGHVQLPVVLLGGLLIIEKLECGP